MAGSFSGCSKLAKNTNAKNEVSEKQRVIVVVTDKQSKAPIKEAKVYIAGDSTAYSTDDMGKTPEIQVDLNKDYFNKYNEDVSSKIQSGFINIAAVKEGYGKHLELDCTIFPGDSSNLIKIEMQKDKKYTSNTNKPDDTYVEKLINSYEKFDGQGTKTENMAKYKIAAVDEAGKPMANVKVVIPEAKLSGVTDKKGVFQMDIPDEESMMTNFPVKKDYSEITVLLYKEGYESKAVFRVCVYQDVKKNTMNLKMKKSKNSKFGSDIIKPSDKWLSSVMDSYQQ